MPRAFSYSLLILLGAFAGLVAGPWVIVKVSPITGVLALYAGSLLVFLLGVDAIVSDSGVRAFARNATEAGRHAALFLASAVIGLCLSVAVTLPAFGLARRLMGPLFPGGEVSDELLNAGWLLTVPAITFAVLLIVLAAMEFIASGSRWWDQLRSLLREDRRGLLGLVLLAGLLDAAVVGAFGGGFGFLGLAIGTTAVIVLVLLVNFLLSNSRIWGVALHMVAEAIRMKVAVLFIAILLVVLFALPFTVAGDGLTLRSRIQTFLAYSLGVTSFLLSVLTVFISCGAVSNEIRTRQIFMVASKPIPRWQFFAGKWLGIGALNAGLLLFTGASVWGFTLYLKDRPTQVPSDREALQFEVLKVRQGVAMDEPTDWNARVDERLRRLREEGRLEGADAVSEAETRRRITEELKRSWRSLGPGQTQEYTFSGLVVDREADDYLQLVIKPDSTSGVDDLYFPLVWQAGDPKDVNTLTNVSRQDLPAKRVSTLIVPVGAVSPDGVLRVRMQNLSERDTMLFEDREAFELLYGIGTFHWNLVRALSIVWCRLAFLAAMGLLASSFVSFPVACVMCFPMLFVASLSGFLMEAVDAATPRSTGEDPLWIVGPILRPLAAVVIWLIPDFSKYDPVGNVVGGRLVPLMWLIVSIRDLLVLQGLILGVIGSLILTRRELAQETA